MTLSRGLLSNYYHVFLILQELHQKLPWYNSKDGLKLPEDKREKRRLYALLKRRNYTTLNDFSVEVLLQVMQKLLRDLKEPLFSISDVVHRRWLDIGDYARMLAYNKIDADIRPDLIVHIARFIHSHYEGYPLLVLQYFLGMLRRLSAKMDSAIGVRFNTKLLTNLCELFAPQLFYRPIKRKFFNSQLKKSTAQAGRHALQFLVVEANEIIATDEYAIMQNLPPKLLTHQLPLFIICDKKPLKKNSKRQ